MGVVGRRGERGVVDYGAMTVVLFLLVYFCLFTLLFVCIKKNHFD